MQAALRSLAERTPRILTSRDIGISVLISIREEALAKLDRFKGRIPNLFHNYLRIERLNHQAAEKAIREPLDRLNELRTGGDPPVAIEQDLVEEILRQVSTGRVVIGDTGRGMVSSSQLTIEAPYLQVVLTRLWEEELRSGSHTLRLSTLRKLGGANSIVKSHLDRVMQALPDTEQRIAASIFHHLVTPSRTKIAHTISDLASYADVRKIEMERLLERLSSGNNRILAPIPPIPGRVTESRFEIFHDVLAPAILDWRSRFVQSQSNAEVRQRATAQGNLLAALQEIGAATLAAVADSRELDSILEYLTDKLGFEYATIGLVDDYQQTIQLARGRNVPQAWMRMSKFSLSDSDILAHCVRMRRVEVIDGWDDRLNAKIFERYQHGKLARVFAPFIDENGTVVGVVQAGCSRERRDIINPQSLREIERIGIEKGPVIGRARPYVPLELIAARAIEVLQADAASLHVFSDGEILMQAGAGMATTEFLRHFQSRPVGIGRRAILEQRATFIDDPVQIASKLPSLYEFGVRALAAFPITRLAGVEGILYISFWRQHAFTAAETDLGHLFAEQMGIVIQNALLLKGLAAEAQKAWDLSGLQNVIQAVASNLNLREMLDVVIGHVIGTLEADGALLYEHPAGNRASLALILGGVFSHAELLANITPYLAFVTAAASTAVFVEDAGQLPVAAGSEAERALEALVQMEQIRSYSALRLQVGQDSLGCLFVFWREHHQFPEGEKRASMTLASSAAIAIRTARLHEEVNIELRRLRSESEATRAVERAIVAGVELQPTFVLILREALGTIGGDAADVMLYRTNGDVIERVATLGGLPEHATMALSVGEGARGKTVQECIPTLITNVKDSPIVSERELLSPQSKSMLAVPIVDGSKVMGVITVESSLSSAFGGRDQDFLAQLQVLAVTAIQKSGMQETVRRQEGWLDALNQVALLVHRRVVATDVALRAVLTGITASEGLGFNTAIILLLEADGRQLRGRMAVGPLTLDEAESSWASRTHLQRSGFKSFLDHIIESDRATGDHKGGIPIENLRVAVDDSTNSVSGCLMRGHARLVTVGSPDSFRDSLAGIGLDMSRAEFLCVPIIGKDNGPLGVLVVDNRFTQAPLDWAIAPLENFATLIAAVLEKNPGHTQPS